MVVLANYSQITDLVRYMNKADLENPFFIRMIGFTIYNKFLDYSSKK